MDCCKFSVFTFFIREYYVGHELSVELVICIGDGDLVYPVETIASLAKTKSLWIVGFEGSVSGDLKQFIPSAREYIDLTQYKDFLQNKVAVMGLPSNVNDSDLFHAFNGIGEILIASAKEK